MKILMAASESSPFTERTPLAALTGNLPAAMKQFNHDVRIVMPRYQEMELGRARLLKVIDKYPVQLGSTTEYCSIYEGKRADGIVCYFIESNRYFGRKGMYGEKQTPYEDNYLRFALFAHGVIDVIRRKLFTPHILHVYDWQASLVPIYLRSNYREEHFSKIPVLLTIQDPKEQGIIEKHLAEQINIDQQLFTEEKLLLHGTCNVLKGAIVFSDLITTISPALTDTLLTPEGGYGLDATLKGMKGKITGILNGMDYAQWDPEHDKLIPYSYTKDAMSGKLLNKSNLSKKLGFEVDVNLPLIVAVSEFTEEKGIDMLTKIIPDLLEEKVLLAVHGRGDRIYEELMKDLAHRNPGRMKVIMDEDEALTHQLFAAGDMVLIPSRYEPFAETPFIAFKYGAAPIAHATGILKDTVQEFSPKSGQGNGFVFKKFTPLAFQRAIRRALDTYRTGRIWKELVKVCMSFDFSWRVTAQRYIALYEQLFGSK